MRYSGSTPAGAGHPLLAAPAPGTQRYISPDHIHVVSHWEKEMGCSGGSLEPPGPRLTHLHTIYTAYSECLPTRLNPVAERTFFSQVSHCKVPKEKAVEFWRLAEELIPNCRTEPHQVRLRVPPAEALYPGDTMHRIAAIS